MLNCSSTLTSGLQHEAKQVPDNLHPSDKSRIRLWQFQIGSDLTFALEAPHDTVSNLSKIQSLRLR